MTTLPPINGKPSAPNSAIGSKKQALSTSTSRRKTKFMTWKDRELIRNQRIRDTVPTMTKVNTALYRNSYKHNLCVKMLKEGFHKSFDEMFCLIEERRKERLEAGIDSVLWQEQSLDDQEEKLNEMAEYLTKAELATRSGKWEDVYDCREHLAEYFLASGDRWLSDHFFRSALDTSQNIHLDGRRRQAEAHCSMGLSLERNGDDHEAAAHMGKFHEVSAGQSWADKDGTLHSSAACGHLCRIYTSLGRKSQDAREQLAYLHQAYDVAKEADERQQVARAALNLGRKYEQTGDSLTAVEFLELALGEAREQADPVLAGEACEALAKSHQTQGDVSRAVEYLEVYATSSRDSDQPLKLVDASNCLGDIYNLMGHYNRSAEYFAGAYDVSNEVGADSEPSAVHLGVAKGHALLACFQGNMEIPARHMMDRIVDWKDERLDHFGQPLPTHHVSPAPSPEPVVDPTEPFRESAGQEQAEEAPLTSS